MSPESQVTVPGSQRDMYGAWTGTKKPDSTKTNVTWLHIRLCRTEAIPEIPPLLVPTGCPVPTPRWFTKGFQASRRASIGFLGSCCDHYECRSLASGSQGGRQTALALLSTTPFPSTPNFQPDPEAPIHSTSSMRRLGTLTRRPLWGQARLARQSHCLPTDSSGATPGLLWPSRKRAVAMSRTRGQVWSWATQTYIRMAHTHAY